MCFCAFSLHCHAVNCAWLPFQRVITGAMQIFQGDHVSQSLNQSVPFKSHSGLKCCLLLKYQISGCSISVWILNGPFADVVWQHKQLDRISLPSHLNSKCITEILFPLEWDHCNCAGWWDASKYNRFTISGPYRSTNSIHITHYLFIINITD